MYWRHFNLTAEPFSLTPDPSFLYLSPVHAEAFAAMTMGLRERRGLITMIGEVGTGKTTLVYSLLSGLGPEIHTAYISNARLSFDGILRLALRDFGVPCESTHNADLLDAFNKFLLDCATHGTTAALVIDEAQNLSQETFEDLRLLSNFETYTHKLLQIVLVGQPELDTKLRDPALRQVAERVAVRCIVNPLTRSQARQYLEHRLAAVNGSLSLFTTAALRLLIARSRGIPRSLNILAHNAMLFAYGEESSRVVRRYVAAAVHEKDGRELIRLWRRPKGRTAVPAVVKPRRDVRSLWALGGAAIAGLALGVMLAGPSWFTGSEEPQPRRAAQKAERSARRQEAAAAASRNHVAAESNDAVADVPPLAPTELPSPTPAAESAGASDVAAHAPASEPAPTNDAATESAPPPLPPAAALPPAAIAVDAPVATPSAAETVPAPQAAQPEIPLAPTPSPAPTEAVNDPGARATPTLEPVASIAPASTPLAPTPLVAAPAIEAAPIATAPIVGATPSAPAPIASASSAPIAPTAVTTVPAEPAPAAAAPVASATPAPAQPSASTAAAASPAAASRQPATRAAAPARAREAAARAPVAPPARTAARAPAKAPTPVPAAAVIPPVVPVPAIAPAVVPPVAAPSAPVGGASLQVAARAVAPGAAADPTARQDPSTVVTVPAGSSLSDLMLAVYGQYNSQMMERVQAVNPQVTDPDFILAGDRLRFPEKATPAAPGTEAR